jgi:hypothetical protein
LTPGLLLNISYGLNKSEQNVIKTTQDLYWPVLI